MPSSNLAGRLQREVQLHLVDLVMRNERISREFGLGITEGQVLHLMVLRPDVRTPSAIAEITGMPTSTVTDVVQRLVAAGYLRREQDESDRRRSRLCLTEATSAMLDHYTSSDLNDQFNDVLAQFTDDELTVVLRYFQALNGATGN